MSEYKVPEGYVLVPKEPEICPVCDFRTKINGRLQHDSKCNLRPKERPDDSDVTDAMRHAAWLVYRDCDTPFTEIYRAMRAAALPEALPTEPTQEMIDAGANTINRKLDDGKQAALVYRHMVKAWRDEPQGGEGS